MFLFQRYFILVQLAAVSFEILLDVSGCTCIKHVLGTVETVSELCS